MEWRADRSARCSGCGNPRVESFDRENRGRYRAEGLQCFACEAMGAEARRMHDQPEGAPQQHGMYISVAGPSADPSLEED